MAKMRVHELAKELEINSKDIIELLGTTEYAVKSAQSGIEDQAQALVRAKFDKKTQKEAAPERKPEPKQEPKKEEPQ